MASRGPRPKAEHEARPKRQKALEVSREPCRPKTHWDHVLDEMVWLSKDFESERKWKLAQAKKVAIRASKGMLDQATRGEKKVKEEEQKLRKVALNISKDVKKFWTKIEKLVLYKHQLELEEKKKKALDRQLDFLLGQTERYSTMLAENLVDMPYPHKQMSLGSATEQHINQDEGDKDGRQINEDEYEKDDEHTKHENEEGDQIISHDDEEGDRHTEVAVEGEPNDLMGLLDGPGEPSSDHMDVDGDYDVQTEDESEDDEHTIEEDEALITREERKEELEGLQDEMDLPLEELLRRYKIGTVSGEESPGGEDSAKLLKESVNLDEAGKDAYISSTTDAGSSCAINHHLGETNGDISMDEHRSDSDIGIGENQDANKSEMQSTFSDCSDNQEEDGDYIHVASEEKDDEITLVEEEELAKDEAGDAVNEIELLQKESEIPIEELLVRYKKDYNMEEDEAHGYTSDSSEDLVDLQACQDVETKGASSPLNKDAPLEAQPCESKLTIAEQEEDESNIKSDNEKDSDDIIAAAAAAARSAQPTGNTFLTTKVRTKFPFLLKHPLREYQHIGLDWLVTMYEKRLNGILADEMGLGKTIMTISLLAHLACEKGIWGPHLIVVPTSVMLNWETEFLKWCPAFKILTYFGSAKERKFKRQGWMKPNSFHVCITTYRLVIQDSKAFKRKKWKYLILDEAHLIKNWKSQRWQTLLNFNSKRRILLTGTPLQNDLMELWSLMHFLMPHIFQSHQEFKDWFSNPISGMVEGQEKVNKEVVDRLHNVLRPFLLRRLKRDVEKQLPGKHEHVIYCRLSKRQRNLYEDFIASSETQATLASSNFFGMISVIMQLRKVCNHPDLFEGRPIISSFDMSGIDMQLSSSICTMLSSSPFSEVNLKGLGLLFTDLDFSMTSWESDEIKAIATPSSMFEDCVTSVNVGKTGSRHRPSGYMRKGYGTDVFDEIQKTLWEERLKEAKERAKSIAWWNSLQCRKKPMYGTSLRDLVTVRHPVFDIHQQKSNPSCYLDFSSKLANIVLSPVERFQRLIKLIESFMFAIPAARASSPVCWCSKSGATVFSDISFKDKCTDVLAPLLSPIRPAIVRRQVYFPDRRLIQFDCGKLQQLAVLLRRLKSEGHRALIFTQMTKMLDVLEAFINLYGYTYMRLDGSTPPEERQTLMQLFNTNPKIFLFILSTRSGGVGINLVGADTVIFYDSDWNPAMDQQAQDRCHRIGQTREVHIYRLISESTIEENILKKANQKRVLDDLVIQSGSYNTEFFKKLDPLELFSGHRELPAKNMQKEKSSNNGVVSLSNADVEAALKQAEDEADYMALKKVEQEEAVENQEFLDEVIGRVEDDELVNEDDAKFDEKAPEDQSTSIAALDNDVDALLNASDPNDDRVLTLTGTEEDDMLADVKQLAAAAAAAGHASSSFENQLRAIDRYAMRFMDLWDPIIDKSALVSQVNFEEKEWELDRIEKFKEDLEAEIDDDEEPFLYEEWDADYATEAYRQQVEVLAQRQLLEDLECEAKEAEDAEKEKLESLRIEAAAEIKSNPKKKTKKKKFKSLKKGALASEVETTLAEPLEYMSMDDESMYADDLDSYSDFIPSHSPVQKKRKKAHTTQNADEEKTKRKNTKKQKKGPENSRVALEYSSLDKQHAGELVVLDLDHRPACRSRMGGKISITTMPVKRVLLIKPEKLNKKGSLWLRGCISLSDSWPSSEDAILCALVHEYGTHWSLVSDVIYGMPAGGFYRGRFRHPFQCCERFRDLFHKYVLSIVESPNNEKVTSTCSGKSILKVTEDGTRALLNITSDLADSECILQKHFTAILSSVWRARSRFNHWSNLSTYQEGFGSARWFVNLKRSARVPKNLGAIGQSSRLVAAVLQDTYKKQQDDISQSEQREACSVMEDPLEIILEVQTYHEDCEILLPSRINILICGSDPPQTENESAEGDMHPDLRSNMAEHRFRGASKACFDGVTQGWSSSSFPAFPAFDIVKSRPTSSKPQSAGKPSKSKKILRGASTEQPREDEHHSPLTSKHTAQILAPKTASAASVGYLFGDSDNIRSCTGGADGGAADRDVTGMDGYGFYEVDATLPYYYDPSFISGLDDYTLLPDITDIG